MDRSGIQVEIAMDDRMAQGGRALVIEMAGSVEEEEDLNIFELMKDQGIDYGQMAEGVPEHVSFWMI